MTIKVIDTTTGKEPTDRVINNIAKNGGLMICDIDGFYVGEDGQIILVDDCGNATWVDMDRFKAVPDVLDKIRAEIEAEIKDCETAIDMYKEKPDIVLCYKTKIQGYTKTLRIIDKYKAESEKK